MPRRPRSLQQAHCYHVVNRGSARARLFYDAKDYDAFLALLGQTVDRFSLPLVAYCLMPNHWHLVTFSVNHYQLSRSLHWLTCTHAIRWCRAHQRKGPGPIYQGRFKSIPVQPGHSLGEVCRYVERNALESSLAERAEEWPWCSANQRVQNRQTPALVGLPFFATSDWLESLNMARNNAAVARAIRHSRPFGESAWVEVQVKELGLSPSGKRGRPKLEKLDPSPFFRRWPRPPAR
jgi:putative transposase